MALRQLHAWPGPGAPPPLGHAEARSPWGGTGGSEVGQTRTGSVGAQCVGSGDTQGWTGMVCN